MHRSKHILETCTLYLCQHLKLRQIKAMRLPWTQQVDKKLKAYLGAHEVEASAVRAQVDECGIRAKKTELISIATRRGTMHLNTHEGVGDKEIYVNISQSCR